MLLPVSDHMSEIGDADNTLDRQYNQGCNAAMKCWRVVEWSAVFCVCRKIWHWTRGCRDLSYRIVSSDKVRALMKVALNNGLNENGKCKMATDIRQQLCCYLTADIFSECGNV